MQQPNTNSESTETEGKSLGELLYRFLPFWPLFAGLLILGVAAAWLYLRYKMPVYATSATLLLKDEKSSTPADELMQAFDMFGSKKLVENEVKVLQSKTLMQEVVRNLHLYAPVTVQGRVLSQSAYASSPVIIEAKYPDSVKMVQKEDFVYHGDKQSVSIDNKEYPLSQWVITPYGVLRFLPNKYYREKSKDLNNDEHFYFSLISVKNAANNILSQIRITPSSKQSTVIDLNMEGEVPQKAEDILNELLTVYNRAAIMDKNVLAANTLKFVEDRLRLVASDLDSIEGSLQKFKVQHKITDISSQGQIYLQTVATNDQKISDINMQLAVLDQVEKYVTSQGGIGGIVPATLGVSDPLLTELLQKLSDLELQYTQIKKVAPENNPAVIALSDGINKVKPEILDNIKSQRKNLIAGRNDLSVTNNRYSSMLTTIPEKERELLGINRQQSIKNEIYTFLLQKREETALSFASTVADSRIIDKAQTSDAPVSPKRKLIYLGAIFIAIALGIAIVYIKDVFTRTIQTRTEIEEYTNMPILGDIIYDHSKSPIVITEGKRSFIAEEFRQLRTSLAYMGIDESRKRILITSSISGEGKSFIAINLGISLSLMEKKVVLIELDLRKPKLSEQFNVSRNTGLSTYLIGKIDMQEIIKPTNVGNLSLIPSGPIPPNPSELISNNRLQELLKYLNAHFDYVLIDTAPINPITDAFILSPMCDVTLFVVRHAYTPKIFLKRLKEKLNTNSLRNSAIVFNGIKGRGFDKYGYGYGYGSKYGYGYGYGYTIDEKPKPWWKRIFKS